MSENKRSPENKTPVSDTSRSGISRRTFLAGATVSGVALSTALAPGASNTAPSRQQPPNVLFLMSDEHSPHALHCDGNEIIRTPALDALAQSGILFSSAYCQNPICVPSRASFITGKMPSHVNVFDNNGGLNNETTIASVFRDAGYTAEWLGKEHWGGKNLGFGDANGALKKELKSRPKDAAVFRKKIGRLPHNAIVTEFPIVDNSDSLTTEHALRFLDNHDGKPFFLGVSYKLPHFPFSIQQRYYDMYKDIIDAPRVTQAMLDDLSVISQTEQQKHKMDTLTESQIKTARALYFGMVTFIDDQIAKILDKLDQLALRDNTIILYTADHGELAGEHGIWYKNSFYEAAASVPFIWSFPKRLPQNQRIDAHVMNMDIFPTLCELCAILPPDDLEGSSLLPLMTGKEDGKNRVALSENYRVGHAGRMIRFGPWKYCWYSQGSPQLYNLVDDPHEERNLIDDPRHAELIADLNTRALTGYIEKPENTTADDDRDSENTPYLEKRLKKYPDADLNKDGVLQLTEWQTYKNTHNIQPPKKPDDAKK